MKTNKTVFGIIAIIISTIICVPNLILFIIMLKEQLITGWGFTTNFELAVIYIWIIQICSLIPFICSTIFTIISIIKNDNIKIKIINIFLLVFITVIMFLTNLFIFM